MDCVSIAGTFSGLYNSWSRGCIQVTRLVHSSGHRKAYGKFKLRKQSQRKISAHNFDLVPPPIDDDFHAILKEMGAQFVESDIIGTFGNDEDALIASNTGIVVTDLSHFGRIRVIGDDRVRFLHNQSTADLQSTLTGEGCDTVFLTPTARTIDIAYAWVMKTAIMVLISPTTCETISAMLNKYIFFADKVEVQDITSKTCFLSIMGPKVDEAMEHLNLNEIIGKPYGTHLHYSSDRLSMTVGVGSVLRETGYSFLLSPLTAGLLWKSLVKFGATPMGARAWERLRVLEGRPAAGKELTDDYNVLEAGLGKAVSLTKGCYIGQETITRLVTYGRVKQQLWGIQLEGPVREGSEITINGKKFGKITSYAAGNKDINHAALGYIKSQDAFVGQEINVGVVRGKLIQVPFITHSLPRLS